MLHLSNKNLFFMCIFSVADPDLLWSDPYSFLFSRSGTSQTGSGISCLVIFTFMVEFSHKSTLCGKFSSLLQFQARLAGRVSVQTSIPHPKLVTGWTRTNHLLHKLDKKYFHFNFFKPLTLNCEDFPRPKFVIGLTLHCVR